LTAPTCLRHRKINNKKLRRRKEYDMPRRTSHLLTHDVLQNGVSTGHSEPRTAAKSHGGSGGLTRATSGAQEVPPLQGKNIFPSSGPYGTAGFPESGIVNRSSDGTREGFPAVEGTAQQKPLRTEIHVSRGDPTVIKGRYGLLMS